MKETKQIVTYSLIDFAIALQEGLKEGYELCVDVNEFVPQQIGTLMVCTLVKPNAAQTAALSEGVNGISKDDLKQSEEAVKVSELHRRVRKG
jgi:hypothetical protein